MLKSYRKCHVPNSLNSASACCVLCRAGKSPVSTGPSAQQVDPERLQLLLFRDGGPFDAGIKGSEKDDFKKGLDPTHYVLSGGIQEQVLYNLSASNDDGLWNRFTFCPGLPSFQVLSEFKHDLKVQPHALCYLYCTPFHTSPMPAARYFQMFGHATH